MLLTITTLKPNFKRNMVTTIHQPKNHIKQWLYWYSSFSKLLKGFLCSNPVNFSSNSFSLCICLVVLNMIFCRKISVHFWFCNIHSTNSGCFSAYVSWIVSNQMQICFENSLCVASWDCPIGINDKSPNFANWSLQTDMLISASGCFQQDSKRI